MELYIRDAEKCPYDSMRKVIDKILIDDRIYQKIGIYINRVLNTEVYPSDPSTDEASEAISKIADKVHDTINQSIDNLLIEKGVDPNFDYEKRCKNTITALIDKYFTEPSIEIFVNGYSDKYICNECKGYITYSVLIRKDEEGRYVIGKFDSEQPHDFITYGYAEDIIYDIIMECNSDSTGVTFNNDSYSFDFKEFCPSMDKKREIKVL